MPFFDELDFLTKVEELTMLGHTVILGCRFEILDEEEDSDDGTVDWQ